jgi:hypothetical protein
MTDQLSMVDVIFEMETRKHQQEVARCMTEFARQLLERASRHDASKLEEPEREAFIKATAQLKDLEYGSEAYMEALKDLGPALEHHYAHNKHHPEYNTINGFAYETLNDPILCMDLMDVVEMVCDWYAASKRVKDGFFSKSVVVNRERFKMDRQLSQICAQSDRIFELTPEKRIEELKKEVDDKNRLLIQLQVGRSYE